MKKKQTPPAEVTKVREAIDDRVFLKDLKVLDQRKDQKIQTLEYYESFKKATVEFVGDTVNQPGKHPINPGDKVIIQVPAGLELEFEGIKYQVVKRSDIICLI